jgi:DNA repair ATPase RecN
MIDKEVIKALEICVGIHNDCCECPLLEYSKATDECMTELMSNALDLINRQQAGIERLQIRLRKERHQFDDLGKMYSEIRTETIKELEAKIHEKLHEAEMHGNFEPVVTREMFDSVVKEMVGEGNG